MLAWIQANLATIVIGILFLLLVTSVILGMVRAKKQGKSSCGCSCGGCDGCGMSGSCHPRQ